MFQYFHDLLATDSLSPHGICLLWRPELIWTRLGADAVSCPDGRLVFPAHS